MHFCQITRSITKFGTLTIIFILGTLVVIFSEKIAGFLSKHIDLDLIFLSQKEKRSNSNSRRS